MVQRQRRRRGIDARLTVYGTGPLLESLRVAAAGLPVDFAGFTSDRATFALALATADVVLAPGPAETFGLSALEALAAGAPVVAAAGAAVDELLQGAHGLAGEGAALSGEAFADAVARVMARPVAVRRAAARTLAERHPWSRTVDAMLAALRSCSARISGSSSGAGPSTGMVGATSWIDNVATAEAGSPQLVRQSVN